MKVAEIFKFFNSAPGDERWHYASDFADYFGNVLSSGLLHKNGTPNLQVKVNAGTMQMYVEAGEALIQGYQYQNTTPLFLTHGLPESNLDRIDRIVLRLDKRNNARFIRLFVKEGVSATNPVPPVLQRDQYVFELSLAQIRLTKNTSSLEPLKLVDERMKEDLCGIVYSLISVPTSVFQQQWDYWFNLKKQTLEDDMEAWQVQQKNDFETWQTIQEQEFLTWFESIKDILTGDVAGNLASRIAVLEQQMTEVNTKIDTHINDIVNHVYFGKDVGNAANSKVITIPATVPVNYPDGLAVSFCNAVTNTGPVALQVNSRANITVHNTKGEGLVAGDMVAGLIYTVRYNATRSAFQLQGESGVKPEHGTKEFVTPGTYSWVVPKGVYNVLVVLNAAGGGGGGFFTFVGGGGNAGGGGGSGGIFVDMVPVTPGETIQIQVGAGGTGGANGYYPTPASRGGDGGWSKFKSSYAYGGAGGVEGSQYSYGHGGAGGSGGGYGGKGQEGQPGNTTGTGGKNPGGIGDGGNTSQPGKNGKVLIKW